MIHLELLKPTSFYFPCQWPGFIGSRDVLRAVGAVGAEIELHGKAEEGAA